MSNEYDREVRQFCAPAIAAEVLAPPADLTISTQPSPSFLIPGGTVSPESILKLRRIGVFSNFADGLVFKNPEEYLTPVVRLYGVLTPSPVVYTGAYTSTAGSKVIAGDFTGVPASSVIRFVPSAAALPTVYQIASLPGTGANVTVVGYVPAGTGTYTVMTATVAGEVYRQYGIRTLNVLEEVNEVLDPGVNALEDAEDVVLFCQLNETGTDFLTKTIGVTFADDTAYFDGVIELEYTPQ